MTYEADTLYAVLIKLEKLIPEGSSEICTVKIGSAVLNCAVYHVEKNYKHTSNNNLFINNDEDAKTQIIIGDTLEVPSGITLTPLKRCPGLILYFSESITILGSVSMSSKGSIAVPQEIKIYQGLTVEKYGALGGAGVSSYSTAATQGGRGGFKGEDAQEGQTGGGGSGGVSFGWWTSAGEISTGKGGQGTSFSGGAGSGGIGSVDYHKNIHGVNASYAVGGDGIAASTRWWVEGLGGAGAITGKKGKTWNTYSAGLASEETGAGGLIILISKKFVNNGSILSQGTHSRSFTVSGNCYRQTGGSSGGGAVFILSGDKDFKQGLVDVSGGASNSGWAGNWGYAGGGAGGTGSVNIQHFKERYLLKVDDSIYNQEGELV